MIYFDELLHFVVYHILEYILLLCPIHITVWQGHSKILFRGFKAGTSPVAGRGGGPAFRKIPIIWVKESMVLQ